MQSEISEYERKLADGDLVSKEWHDEQVLQAENVINEQKSEIERLTEEKEDLYFQNQNLQTYIDNHEPIWKRNAEQAVKETAEKFAERAKERLEQYRLSKEWEESDNQWRLDSTIFCAEVVLDGGLIDEICKEMVDGKCSDQE